MDDKPQYVPALFHDGAVIVDDFPSSDLLHVQTRVFCLNQREDQGPGTYRVAKLTFVDEEA